MQTTFENARKSIILNAGDLKKLKLSVKMSTKRFPVSLTIVQEDPGESLESEEEKSQ